MKNIIKIFILMFAMSFLSGQVLAQSPFLTSTSKKDIANFDAQIVAAEKAGDWAKFKMLKKKKLAAIKANRKAELKAKQAQSGKKGKPNPKWAATPKIDAKIKTAKKAGDKAKVKKLLKRKAAIIAKRKAKQAQSGKKGKLPLASGSGKTTSKSRWAGRAEKMGWKSSGRGKEEWRQTPELNKQIKAAYEAGNRKKGDMLLAKRSAIWIKNIDLKVQKLQMAKKDLLKNRP